MEPLGLQGLLEQRNHSGEINDSDGNCPTFSSHSDGPPSEIPTHL